jgi:nicotinamide-nucleotide amidase
MTLAEEVYKALLDRGHLLATAESCTGGKVAAAITDIAGSSAVFDRGFVTYSNAAKSEMLGVPPALIQAHGAVSEAVARAMAQGALKKSQATISIAITGIAGPTRGTETKPVGLVHFCCASTKKGERAERMIFSGDRKQIRALACNHALLMVQHALLSEQK